MTTKTKTRNPLGDSHNPFFSGTQEIVEQVKNKIAKYKIFTWKLDSSTRLLLDEISLKRLKSTGEKPHDYELVQESLNDFFKKEGVK